MALSQQTVLCSKLAVCETDLLWIQRRLLLQASLGMMSGLAQQEEAAMLTLCFLLLSPFLHANMILSLL